MANQQATRAEEPRTSNKIKCRVVQRYAGRNVGEHVEVDLQEYNRLRSTGADGEHTYPVLISAEHAREQERIATAKREAEENERRGPASAADSVAWSEKQREALDILNARALEEARKVEEHRRKLSEDKGAATAAK